MGIPNSKEMIRKEIDIGIDGIEFYCQKSSWMSLLLSTCHQIIDNIINWMSLVSRSTTIESILTID